MNPLIALVLLVLVIVTGLLVLLPAVIVYLAYAYLAVPLGAPDVGFWPVFLGTIAVRMLIGGRETRVEVKR